MISEAPIFPHWRVQRNFHGFQVLVTTESLQKTASPARQKCRREEHSKINHCPPSRLLQDKLKPSIPSHTWHSPTSSQRLLVQRRHKGNLAKSWTGGELQSSWGREGLPSAGRAGGEVEGTSDKLLELRFWACPPWGSSGHPESAWHHSCPASLTASTLAQQAASCCRTELLLACLSGSLHWKMEGGLPYIQILKALPPACLQEQKSVPCCVLCSPTVTNPPGKGCWAQAQVWPRTRAVWCRGGCSSLAYRPFLCPQQSSFTLRSKSSASLSQHLSCRAACRAFPGRASFPFPKAAGTWKRGLSLSNPGLSPVGDHCNHYTSLKG